MEVYCLNYAESTLPASMAFQGGDSAEKIPITFAVYLILTEDRKILVDAGCHTMPGFEMKNFSSAASVLKEMGINPEEITDLLLTHAHHDHCEATADFKNATVHLAKAAYEKAKRHIPAHFKVNLFEKELCLTPQIKMTEWGGHAQGSCIVELQGEDAIHILAGDECYTNANLQQKIPTGSSCDLEKSAAFIERFSQLPYRVHTCHDASLKTERILL